jgi:hypothetical protein
MTILTIIGKLMWYTTKKGMAFTWTGEIEIEPGVF